MSDWYDDSLNYPDDSTADEDDLFDWDDGNLDHITRHGVSAEEAEEALLDPRRRGMTVYSAPDEQRQGAIGATEDRRILAIVFTIRSGKARVITARDATPTERRRYGRR